MFGLGGKDDKDQSRLVHGPYLEMDKINEELDLIQEVSYEIRTNRKEFEKE